MLFLTLHQGGLSPAWSTAKVGRFAMETTWGNYDSKFDKWWFSGHDLAGPSMLDVFWQNEGNSLWKWNTSGLPKKYWDWTSKLIKGPLALGKRQAPPICRTAFQKRQINQAKSNVHMFVYAGLTKHHAQTRRPWFQFKMTNMDQALQHISIYQHIIA